MNRRNSTHDRHDHPDTRVRCRPIVDADIEKVARYSRVAFRGGRNLTFWTACVVFNAVPLRQTSRATAFFSMSAVQVVGTVLLMFSEREGADGVRCNIASWYVDRRFGDTLRCCRPWR